MPYLTMAVAMAVRRPKQSARLAATLYSPPETCTSNERALRNGTTPGSSRWTSAPRERKSNWQASVRTGKPFMDSPGRRNQVALQTFILVAATRRVPHAAAVTAHAAATVHGTHTIHGAHVRRSARSIGRPARIVLVEGSVRIFRRIAELGLGEGRYNDIFGVFGWSQRNVLPGAANRADQRR